MARVTQHKARQAIVITDPNSVLEDGLHIEELALFDVDGNPVALGGGYRRSEYEHSAPNVGAGLINNSEMTIWPSWRIFKVSTNYPARVRIYATAAQRDADANRAIGNKPQGDHGRLFELVTTADDLQYTLSPVVDLSSDIDDGLYYVAVTNLGEVTRTILTTYHYVRTE